MCRPKTRREPQRRQGQLPASLAAWFRERTQEIGLCDPQATFDWSCPSAVRMGRGHVAHPFWVGLRLADRKTRQRACQAALAATEMRTTWPFGRSKKRKIDRNPFIVTLLSRMLVSCQHGIQKIISSKCNRRNEPNNSDAANWTSGRGVVFVCDRCGRIMGIEHFVDQPDSDRLARCWRNCAASHRCYGGELLGLPPDREIGQSSR